MSKSRSRFFVGYAVLHRRIDFAFQKTSFENLNVKPRGPLRFFVRKAVATRSKPSHIFGSPTTVLQPFDTYCDLYRMTNYCTAHQGQTRALHSPKATEVRCINLLSQAHHKPIHTANNTPRHLRQLHHVSSGQFTHTRLPVTSRS